MIEYGDRGAVWIFSKNTDISKPTEDKDEGVRVIAEAKASCEVLNFNAGFFHDDAQGYKGHVHHWINEAIENGLKFLLTVHRYTHGSFACGPGNNYKIAETEPYRTNTINVMKELTQDYGNHPLFMGWVILNEPVKEPTFAHWDSVMQYYEDVIDAVRVTHPDCYFGVMEPYKWGSGYNQFLSRGFVDRPNTGAHHHKYFDPGHWDYIYKDTYAVGKYAEGKQAMYAFLDSEIKPMIDAGYPVVCCEFGTWWGTSGWEKQIEHQMEWYEDHEVPWFVMQFHNDGATQVKPPSNTHHRFLTNGWSELNGWGEKIKDEFWSLNDGNGGEELSFEYENKETTEQKLELGKDEIVTTFIPRVTVTVPVGEKRTLTLLDGERVRGVE